MADQLLPTRAIPGYLENPEYLRARQQQARLEQGAPRFPAIPQDPMIRPSVNAVPDPRFMPSPEQMPGSSLPQRVADPRYTPPAVRPPATPLRDPAAEGPRLDGMRASELFYDRPVSQLRSGRDVSAEGPLLDDMLAAELFKRAQDERRRQAEMEAMVRRMEAQGFTR